MNNKNNIAIELSNVSKKYVIHHEKPTLLERVLQGKNEEFWALKNINLKIKRGERVGVIGPNGCGKTTLLKLITGIASPTIGKITTNGKIVSLIDLEAGFHPDLTGIQNIYLNSMLIGMKEKEIDSKLNDIIEFADIGKFINAQLFTYSSGMKLRLGFSIAIHSDPDILVLDENISVGDLNFNQKVTKKINNLINGNNTLIIASHLLNFIESSCDRAILIKNGKIVKSGKPNQVINKYII